MASWARHDSLKHRRICTAEGAADCRSLITDATCGKPAAATFSGLQSSSRGQLVSVGVELAWAFSWTHSAAKASNSVMPRPGLPLYSWKPDNALDSSSVRSRSSRTFPAASCAACRFASKNLSTWIVRSNSNGSSSLTCTFFSESKTTRCSWKESSLGSLSIHKFVLASVLEPLGVVYSTCVLLAASHAAYKSLCLTSKKIWRNSPFSSLTTSPPVAWLLAPSASGWANSSFGLSAVELLAFSE
mmetsp:Transcript_104944/g.165598  ORF Transcript_104944/g.165598 Transcript_104944/m.165598 type:complete len:244 (-) Transcript_104944:877-1608(-)